MSLNIKSFGSNLRKVRERAGFSQKGLDEAAILAESTIWRYERGRYPPSLTTFVKICNVLDCSADELLRDET